MADAQQGPYKRKYTSTVKISPIELTITRDEDSTHVPPECHCHDQPIGVPPGAALQAILSQFAELIRSRMANAPGVAADEPPPADPDVQG